MKSNELQTFLEAQLRIFSLFGPLINPLVVEISGQTLIMDAGRGRFYFNMDKYKLK
jgi:hypothetical protein